MILPLDICDFLFIFLYDTAYPKWSLLLTLKAPITTNPGRFGPIPLRSGRFGPRRFGPISGVSRFSPVGAGRFGPIS